MGPYKTLKRTIKLIDFFAPDIFKIQEANGPIFDGGWVEQNPIPVRHKHQGLDPQTLNILSPAIELRVDMDEQGLNGGSGYGTAQFPSSASTPIANWCTNPSGQNPITRWGSWFARAGAKGNHVDGHWRTALDTGTPFVYWTPSMEYVTACKNNLPGCPILGFNSATDKIRLMLRHDTPQGGARLCVGDPSNPEADGSPGCHNSLAPVYTEGVRINAMHRVRYFGRDERLVLHGEEGTADDPCDCVGTVDRVPNFRRHNAPGTTDKYGNPVPLNLEWKRYSRDYLEASVRQWRDPEPIIDCKPDSYRWEGQYGAAYAGHPSLMGPPPPSEPSAPGTPVDVGQPCTVEPPGPTCLPHLVCDPITATCRAD
jgi:hypothetical protein